MHINRVSKLFQPVNVLSKAATDGTSCKSSKLMTDVGIIEQVNNGTFAFLPLGQRVLDKLSSLVERQMIRIGCQKVCLSALTSPSLWKQSGRLEKDSSSLFKVYDRHKKCYILNPTCEEAIVNLVSSYGAVSPKLMPLKLYQISNKWRDEMRPHHGLLRSREFVMKDLYTFDASIEDARSTYELVDEAYCNIFREIGLDFTKAIGDTGSIGGLESHEYHYHSEIGEDVILTCSNCSYSINKTISTHTECPDCKSSLTEKPSIEVGHSFLLGDKYTKPLKALVMANGKAKPLTMGCYGLGLSRILAAVVEILSTENEIRWPSSLAPFQVCVIPPKDGSKEMEATRYVQDLSNMFTDLNVDFILDDRTGTTIGKRVNEARRTGYPYLVVIGKQAMLPNPLFEVHNLNTGERFDVPLEDIPSYISGRQVQEKVQLKSV